MLNSLFPRFARFTLESLLLLASHLSALLYDLEFSQRGGGGEGGGAGPPEQGRRGPPLLSVVSHHSLLVLGQRSQGGATRRGGHAGHGRYRVSVAAARDARVVRALFGTARGRSDEGVLNGRVGRTLCRDLGNQGRKN